MSNLRNSLNDARTAYEALRYPGDLAVDLGPVRLPRWQRGIILTALTGGLLATAASVAVLLAPVKESPRPDLGGTSLSLMRELPFTPPKMEWMTPALPSMRRLEQVPQYLRGVASLGAMDAQAPASSANKMES